MALRYLALYALFLIFAAALMSYHFDGRPQWCPSDVPSDQCAEMNNPVLR